MFNVLLVEDNIKISENVVSYLNDSFSITPVFSVSDALLHLNSGDYDIIILDLMLPDGDGLRVLKSVQDRIPQIGVIVLTAKEALDEKLLAFDLGAQDYLTKPFFNEELKVRILRILKNLGKIDDTNTPAFLNLKLDQRTKTASINGEILELNEKGYHLLEYFVTNKGTLLFKEQIFDRICGMDSDASVEIVEVYISRLRKQLAQFGYDKYLITRRGMGYVLEERGASENGIV